MITNWGTAGLKRRTVAILVVIALVGSVLGGVAYQLLMPPKVVSPGDFSFTMKLGGLERSYTVHVPAKYDGRTAMAVVIMLHGRGLTGKGAMNDTGWAEKADKVGFLAVFPEATPPDPSKPLHILENPQMWNEGSGRGHACLRNVDDVGFVNAIIDDLCSRFVVDEMRIFVTGFSAGAHMTYRLGVELSNRIAAVAPVSGLFWLNVSKLDYPVPLVCFFGTGDPVVPFRGGVFKNAWGETLTYPSCGDSVMRWVRLLGCPDKPVEVDDREGVRRVVYGPGRGGSEVVFYTIEGGGHTWPGGRSALPERVVGKMTYKITATDVIWEFFQKHPRKTDYTNIYIALVVLVIVIGLLAFSFRRRKKPTPEPMKKRAF